VSSGTDGVHAEKSPVPFSVVIAGGGTGGHLYPGIAVARELLSRRPGAAISFAGTASGIEARVIPREGFALDLIRSGGLKGKSVVARARGAALVPIGLVDAWRIVTARRPDLVIGVGGYSSGPVVLVAALRGVPTMVMEQNAVPGLTNRMLSRYVQAARDRVRAGPAQPTLFASDIAAGAIARTQAHLAAAKVDGFVQVERADVLTRAAPAAAGVIVTNPPYGVRLAESNELAAFYPRLGDSLKRHFPGWRANVLTGDLRLAKLIGLKADRRTPLYNGALECRLVAFRLVAGSNR
jgi:hypothetical protein